ncbi:hypothetical protein H072_1105 [Dactylellina haptotyla CBS 200.50]|uniref:GPI ethanolamine phosphate transferase 1 n=1 Tax=Dactylellina haptotyla (strain CBS 200.50) TaxID=1284197 RepID=S8APZ0_DACHA|nr:hypothetical protein H072_1105 [Dactylellina haptotyla CBS 200.50]
MQLTRLTFLAIAAIFHFAYIWSIFDIYFVSPIVHGMRHHSSGVEAPAKRLFFIVGDGFRADKCFQSHIPPFLKDGEDPRPRPLAPFLRSRVTQEGSFGVSHTRMPTESRPGHVALIAGLYEDVSAVTTGWKLNPVNFDSVFNQSRHTWSWGSPDILAMFKEGAITGRVDAYMYAEEDEDFASDATKLDTWVFEHVNDFFAQAAVDDKLRTAVSEDKLVFFLHLLGLDTTGHGYRPYSQEYLRNIEIVDKGVEELVKLVENFYGNDGKTAWVFTADHGMSDWGSHGDGHPDNTRTPLITWGAGIRKPETAPEGEIAGGHDEFSSDWNLNHIRRVDVNQADIAALMAYLVGLNYPANSVGVLPLDFLDASDKMKAQAIFANALEILEMFKVKEANKMATQINFAPFSLLHEGTSLDTSRIAEIQTAIEYDWLFLRTLVTLGYLGWISFALTSVIQQHFLQKSTSGAQLTGFFAALSVLVGTYTVIYIQQSPWTYYMYAFAPIFFWWRVWYSRGALTTGLPLLTRNRQTSRLILDGIGFIAVLEAICGLIALAMIVTHGSVESLRAKQGLPFGNQVLGVLILVLSLSALPLHRFSPLGHYQHRLMVLFLTFSPTFIILTISYEGLFYIAFCAMLASWVQMEYTLQLNNGTEKIKRRSEDGLRPLNLSDNRIALFFFFFIQAGFFGTGNVASLSAFSLESVYRLTTVFNPFLMTALLVFKLLIPFVIISANLGILNRILRVPPSALFMIVMSISDILTLNFFYMVKDEGSWLDIGTTISHFVIASLLCVFVAMLELLSEILVGDVTVVEKKID